MTAGVSLYGQILCSSWCKGFASYIIASTSGSKLEVLTNYSTSIVVPSQWLFKTSACCDMFGEFPPFLSNTVHDVTALNRYNPGKQEGKHLSDRGRPFVHPMLIMEDVLSTERM